MSDSPKSRTIIDEPHKKTIMWGDAMDAFAVVHFKDKLDIKLGMQVWFCYTCGEGWYEGEVVQIDDLRDSKRYWIRPIVKDRTYIRVEYARHENELRCGQRPDYQTPREIRVKLITQWRPLLDEDPAAFWQKIKDESVKWGREHAEHYYERG